MPDLSHSPINMAELDHIGIVVRDINKSMELMRNNFAIGSWNVEIVDASSMNDTTCYGKPAQFRLKVASTDDRKYNTKIELIQHLKGDNVYQDFLSHHGEGIHHICTKVNSLEAFAYSRRYLEKSGFPCIMSGQNDKVSFAYFDTARVLNTILEVQWVKT